MRRMTSVRIIVLQHASALLTHPAFRCRMLLSVVD